MRRDGGDVSHAKLARVKHASPMKQEPTEVILQDEYLEERRRNPRSIMGRWPMVFRVAKEGRGGCQCTGHPVRRPFSQSSLDETVGVRVRIEE